MIIGENKANQI
jgi:hypothetical protein